MELVFALLLCGISASLATPTCDDFEVSKCSAGSDMDKYPKTQEELDKFCRAFLAELDCQLRFVSRCPNSLLGAFHVSLKMSRVLYGKICEKYNPLGATRDLMTRVSNRRTLQPIDISSVIMFQFSGNLYRNSVEKGKAAVERYIRTRVTNRESKSHKSRGSSDESNKRHSRSPPPPERAASASHTTAIQPPPKSQSSNSCERSSPENKLSHEIWSLYENIYQTQETLEVKMEIRQRLQEIISAIFQNITLIPYGSTVNGFGLMTSDLDLCLMIPEIQAQDNDRIYKALSAIQEVFSKFNAFGEIRIKHSGVPIIKMKELTKNIRIDVNINYWTSIITSHLIASFSNKNKNIKALGIILKYWCKENKLPLKSYAVVLMVIHFGQFVCLPPLLPSLGLEELESYIKNFDLTNGKAIDLPEYTSHNKCSIAQLLIEFFEYFGEKFNYEKFAISIRKRQVRLEIEDIGFEFNRQFIVIEDPIHIRSNVAANISNETAFHEIKNALTRSLNILKDTSDLKAIM